MSDSPQNMECPYCQKAFHVNFQGSLKVEHQTPDEYHYTDEFVYKGLNNKRLWRPILYCQNCPSCQRLIVVVEYEEDQFRGQGRLHVYKVFRREILYPKTISNRTVAPEVPQQYADDFIEACNVASISPRASAMLSRRLLQTILHKQYNIKEKDLFAEINTFIDNQHPPTILSEYLHPLRVVGNFGAHPIEDQSSGDDIKVEPKEAEWLLALLEELFDFAYVKPARFAAMKQGVNQNLQSAGRNPIP